MSRAADDRFERWMTEHTWDLTTTQKTISNILTSGATDKGALPIQDVAESG